MLPGQMMPGQMSMWQSTSVKVGPRKLTLNFGQNQVSNSGDIANMEKCHQDKCHMDKCCFHRYILLLRVNGYTFYDKISGSFKEGTLSYSVSKRSG